MTSVLLDDELAAQYDVEYRVERNETVTFDRSPRAQYQSRARFRRQSTPQVHNGMHRRGRKNFV